MPDREAYGWQRRIGRRNYIKGAGVAAVMGLAGCSGNGNGDGGDGSDGGDGADGSDGGDGGDGSDGSDGGDGADGSDGGDGADGGDGEDGDGDDGGAGDGGSDPIQIGVLMPFTGDLAQWANWISEGVEVAAEEINNSGGVNGREISLVTQDSKGTSQGAVAALETLDSQGVVGIIGAFSGQVPPLYEPVREAQIPCISSGGTTFLDDKGGEWWFRSRASDSASAKGWATYIHNKSDWGSAALAYLDTAAAASSVNALDSELQRSDNVSITRNFSMSRKSTSYRSEITELNSTGQDVNAVNMSTETGTLFLRNYAELGADIPLTLGEIITGNSEVIAEVGADAMEGITGFSGAPADHYGRFVETAQEILGNEPGSLAEAGYDAMNVSALALQYAGEVSRTALANNLRTVGNPPGPTAVSFPEGKEVLANNDDVNLQGARTTLDFNELGDVLGPSGIFQVQDGEWVQIQHYSGPEDYF